VSLNVVDYASLTAAIGNFTHNTALSTGGSPISDLFIQKALEQIAQDIPDLNFGNYIRLMENAFPVCNITGGTLPVPVDWLGPKELSISDFGGNTFDLIFKSPGWIKDIYPQRVPNGMPSYIARDVMAPASFTASLNTAGVLAVSALASGILQTGLVLSDNGVNVPANVPPTALIVTGQTSGTSGGTGNYTAASIAPLAPTYTIASEAMTGGGNVFIFGPYPDGNYQVAGTYYQKIPGLSSGNTTNWVVLNAPMMLLEACMKQAALFLEDDQMLARWNGLYTASLKALVDQDKAERWSQATMQVETA
jgi:hypothetical protein